MIKITDCYKVPGYKYGTGPHWILKFHCSKNYSKAYRELRDFAKVSFTPGELFFVDEEGIVMWDDGCIFSARVYQDKDAMLMKLVYG